jgi:hypothetical protein
MRGDTCAPQKGGLYLLETAAMPADQRRRLHDDHRLTPIEPAGVPDQRETCGRGGGPWFDAAFAPGLTSSSHIFQIARPVSRL